MLSNHKLGRSFLVDGSHIPDIYRADWQVMISQSSQYYRTGNQGKHWETNNCMGCHTILERGFYALGLPKSSIGMVKAILQSHSMETHGRKMVAYEIA